MLSPQQSNGWLVVIPMTKQRQYHARCPVCGQYPVICQKCGGPATGATPFSDWLRSAQCPEELSSKFFDCQNLDYIWFNYCEGWFILIEEKQLGGYQRFNQRDTHSIVDQLLTKASSLKYPVNTVNTLRGKRVIEYKGYYQVTFSNGTPDNSEHIWINGHLCSREGLLSLLKHGSLDFHHVIKTYARAAKTAGWGCSNTT